MNELTRFQNGFPELHWALYHDRKLNKDTILSLSSGIQFETMPQGKKMINRYKLKSI
jgi:hypothetical protein